VSEPIVVDATNAGTEFPMLVVSDEQLPTTLTVKKVDSDTGAALSGATFQLWRQGGDSGDSLVGTCTTDDTGTCSIDGPAFGTYYWVETAAPAGYLLPDDPKSDLIVVDADNAGTEMGVVTFADVPTGSLSIHKVVDKTSAEYGDTLTYTLQLHAVGPQLQNDVTVTDYLPGYDPADHDSGKVTYVDGSAGCSVACTTSYDGTDHQLTWRLSAAIPPPTDVELTFRATIDTPAADANGALPAEQIDNAAVVSSDHTPKTRSNKVVTTVVAVLGEKIVKPPTQPSVLPFTGAAVPIQPAIWAGMLLIGIGVALAGVRRRRA